MDQDDGAIVERVLAGDRDAFGILIDRHREGATRFALRILRGRAEAEDVVQEAWLHAFLELAELPGSSCAPARFHATIPFFDAITFA